MYRKAAQLMASRKQSKRKRILRQDIPFKGMPPVTRPHLLIVQSAIESSRD
jgi:hypothetical protein